MAVRTLAVAVACLTAGACTSVTVRNAEVVRTSHFGVVVLRIVPGRDSATVITTRGVGLTVAARSTTLGVLTETVLLAPDGGACKAFILIYNDLEEAELRRLLQQQPQLSQICVITGEEK